MQILDWKTLTTKQKQAALSRPTQTVGEQIKTAVETIREAVLNRGDQALFELSEKFDRFKLTQLTVSTSEISTAGERVPDALKSAIRLAKRNIEKFHQAQQNQEVVLGSPFDVSKKP